MSISIRRSTRWWTLAVAGVAFVAALFGIDARATYGARVSVDEPQYLLTALSIAEDFDLDISDEIDEQAYRSFHERDLDPQTTVLNPTGQRLSPHDPLLPLLLAAPVGFGGWAGAKVVLAIVAATTAAATVLLAVRRYEVDARVGGLVTMSFFVAAPFTAYGTQIYPAMPAALCVVVGLYALTGTNDWRHRLLVVTVVVLLPWFAVKFVPISGVLAAGLLWRNRAAGHRRHGAVTAAMLGLAAVVYVVVHQRIYGGWTVYASGDHFVGGEFEVLGTNPNYVARSNRLIGLLIDRSYGVAAWAPAFLLMPAGLAALVTGARTNSSRHFATTMLLAPLAAGWAVATWVALTMHGWWWPGRQIVSVLPLVVVAVAVLVDQHRHLLAPTVALGAWGFVNWAWITFEASTNRRALIVDFDDTSNPLYQAWRTLLPDHQIDGTTDQLLTLAWIVALAMTARHFRSTGNQIVSRSRRAFRLFVWR